MNTRIDVDVGDRPLTVIMNPGSGHGDGATIRRTIAEALAAAGRAHRIVDAHDGTDLARTARSAVVEARRTGAIVVAAGGDGTLNAIANEVADSGVPFGVIPLGTFNYFARDLGIPVDPASAVRALLDGRLRPVHVARLNGHVLLNNASFGLYQRVLADREGFKQRFGRYRIMAAVSGFATLLRHHRSYNVEMTVDGRLVTVRTPMLFFACNTLQLEHLSLPVADCTAAGRVAMLVLKPISRPRLLGMALRGALGGLATAGHLECHCASHVVVRTRRPRRTVPVAIDGETIECTMPLAIDVARDALQVVVPRDPVPRA